MLRSFRISGLPLGGPAPIKSAAYTITALSILVNTFSLRLSLSTAVITVLFLTLTTKAMSFISTRESFETFLPGFVNRLAEIIHILGRQVYPPAAQAFLGMIGNLNL